MPSRHLSPHQFATAPAVTSSAYHCAEGLNEGCAESLKSAAAPVSLRADRGLSA
jgi:hypothetical protein